MFGSLLMVVKQKMKNKARYFYDCNGVRFSKRTGKPVQELKVPYGCGASKTKQYTMKEITKECNINYIGMEHIILSAKKVLETQIIPFNI